LLGGPQKFEKYEECSDIEKREGSGDLESQRPIEGQAMAIDRIERTAEDLRRANTEGQNLTSMPQVNV
jgi:hypothetical protein